MDGDKMPLDVYIYDCLVKRGLKASAEAFQEGGNIPIGVVAIDAPGGFLFEWWSVFSDIFNARTNANYSDVAASYIETQLIKAREQEELLQFQDKQLQQQQYQQQQQQRRDGYLLKGSSNELVGNDSMLQQNLGTTNTMAANMYEEPLKMPLKDSIDRMAMKKIFGENGAQLWDSNQIFKSATSGSQTSGQVTHGTVRDTSPQLQGQSEQLLGSIPDMKNEMNPILNPREAGPEGSMTGIHGTMQSDNNLTLEGLPLTGFDKIRPEITHQRKSYMHMPNPQQQQQIMPSQQNLTSLSASDLESRRLKMLMNNPNTALEKDVISNCVGDVSSIGSYRQAGYCSLPCGDPDMLLKPKMAQVQHQQQNTNHQPQQQLQHVISSQRYQNSDHNLHHREKIGVVGNEIAYGSLSNSFRATDRVDMDVTVHDVSFDDSIEYFMSHGDKDPGDTVDDCMDVNKGLTLMEVGSIQASSSKVICCHFSSDGKLLASGGHDKKVILWNSDTLKAGVILEEHSALITDVRFSQIMPRVATSSFDRNVRVWDIDNPGFSLRNFKGHSSSVMSLDFHPNKDDLLCSCDVDGEIRYWSINNGNCSRIFKGATDQVRFQPRQGMYLAAAAGNIVSVVDVETQACRHLLKGHTKQIHSLCWSASGDLLASVSEDSVRVWTLGSGNKEGACTHELRCNGNKFYSCVFHPTNPLWLVIGCYQSLELWNMRENKTTTLSAHEGLVASLSVSTATGLIASASHDKIVKLWK